MKHDDYQSGRPHGLRHGPGILDACWDLWCKLKGKSPTISFETAVKALPPQELPPYVQFADNNVVCIHQNQKILIDAFCQHNKLDVSNLFLPVLKPDHIAVKRDVLENLVHIAADIFTQNTGNSVQLSTAQNILSDFDFLETTQNHQPPAQPPAYKLPAAWERHNQ